MAAGDIKGQKENVGATFDEVNLVDEFEAAYNSTTVTLASAGWSAYTQSETISGLTATSDVMVFPPVARAGFLAYGVAQISATSVTTDSITFTCTTEPEVDIENIIVLWR